MKNTKRQKDEEIKRQRPKREFNIVMSGQFRDLAMCVCKMRWQGRVTLAQMNGGGNSNLV